MKRHDHKTRGHEQSSVETKIKTTPPPQIIEADPQTIRKLLSGNSYSAEDIQKCARALLEEHGYDHKTHLGIFEDVDELFEALSKLQHPIFIIYSQSKHKWSLLYKNDSTKVSYKNPTGTIDKTLKARLNIKFVANTTKDLEDGFGCYYGPITLRNLNLVLNTKNVDFVNMKFCTQKEVSGSKRSGVLELTCEIAKNAEFKAELKQFIDTLPLDLSASMANYRKVLEEETMKEEGEIDHTRIKQARKACMDAGKIEEISKRYSCEEQDKEFQLKIQKLFPEETKKFQDILEVLDDLEVDDDLRAALASMSQLLGIDVDKMQNFYEQKLVKPVEAQEEKLDLEDIDAISARLPDPVVVADDCSALSDLLKGITLGMDGREVDVQEIAEIERKFQKVKGMRKSLDAKAVNNWAKSKKGHIGSSDEELCEVIAMLENGYNLVTGYSLRDTQILAVLIFTHHQSTQGRLCQIQTGEGKTVIVSLLATFKALQGYTVDVITSNPVLAEEGVDETKTFYNLFGLTVATNNVGSIKDSYNADVLYGTISNFQFDFLKDSFEGFNIRNDRNFGQVILDEVDSMLVDNGGHIAKLAAPFPGMESLRYIYIRIWQELLVAEQSFHKEIETKIDDLENLRTKDNQKYFREVQKVMQETAANEHKFIKDQIKKARPADVELIPKHLKTFIDKKLDVWIKNALHAKFNCHEHQQYRIATDDSGERVVVPVDYQNTGVTLKNTIWSNGLHQFIQLKHNLFLTFESLTSSFISNIGYIKNYQDCNIFGLTGTLGSTAEQKLLSSIYNVNYAKLPTYKEKKFSELAGIVAKDQEWHKKLAFEVVKATNGGRAVLVICETEQDLMKVKKALEILNGLPNGTKLRLRMFANEEQAEESVEKVRPGDVIIATNIAGRGTNFKTVEQLENAGGLHVIVGFLPCNKRVEDQAFGRTSRQGNSGSAQLVIRRSEIDELSLDGVDDFTQIKTERDKLEKNRLKEINEVLVKELNFKDALFAHFSQFHREQKAVFRGKMQFMFAMQDLKEYWAFWLEEKDFNIKNIKGTDPLSEFESFKARASRIISGVIMHNPYYSISKSEFHLAEEERGKAREALNHALSLGDPALMYGAHIKLFELAIDDGQVMRGRFKNALETVFCIDVVNHSGYKNVAVGHLQNALMALEKEIGCLNAYLSGERPNKKFNAILITAEDNKNPFLDHLYSRAACLEVYKNNVNDLIKSIRTMNGGVDFQGRIPGYLETLEPGNSMAKTIKQNEVIELSSCGLNTVYVLKAFHDIPKQVIWGAVGQVAGGIALVTVGLFFLPVFPVMAALGGTLISEGIMDIAMELIKQSSDEFDEKDFMKGKFVSYGISLLTMGIGAIAQCTKIMNKAIEYCRKLSAALRRSPKLKGLCERVAKLVDKLGAYLQTALLNAKAAYAEKIAKASATRAFGNIAWNTAKSVTWQVFKVKLLENCLKELFGLCKGNFKQKIKDNMLNDAVLVRKLRNNEVAAINATFDEFSNSEPAVEICKDLAKGCLEYAERTACDAFVLAMDLTESVAKLSLYIKVVSEHLKKTLGDDGNSNNNVVDVVNKISDKMADYMCGNIVGICQNTCKFAYSTADRHGCFDPVKDKVSSMLDQIKINTGIPLGYVPADTIADGDCISAYWDSEGSGASLSEMSAVLGVEPDAPSRAVSEAYMSKAIDMYMNSDDVKLEHFGRYIKAYEAITRRGTF